MGSFDYTCAVSGLPIHSGDEVRFLLLSGNPYGENKGSRACTMHDWWFPRTFPIRAVYNEYGSVEKVEEGPARDIWLDALKIDLVSRGWGDNSVHDVPTSPDMTFEELLGAIQEGRILVRQNVGRERTKDSFKMAGLKRKAPPKGVPTRKRVTAVIVKAGLPLFQGWGKEGYLIDRKGYGTVRVRWHGEGATWNKDAEALEKVQKLLGEYATIIKAGTGSYANSADLFVHVKPGTKDFHRARKDRNPSLPVSQVMIREDVWQALLGMSFRERWDSRKPSTIKSFRASVQKLYKTTLQHFKEEIERRETIKALPEEQRKALAPFYDLSDIYLETKLDRDAPGSWVVSKNVIPFTVGLSTHWKLFVKRMLEAGDHDPKPFLDSVAEMAYVQQVLMYVRFIWNPSSSRGAQVGEFDKHLTFHKAMAQIAEARFKEDEERYG